MTAPNKLKISLSDYLPKGTVYFYSFPAGQDSKFYNNVPAHDEELVSARPLVCAGDHVKVITFASAASDYSFEIVSKNIQQVSRQNAIVLPDTITAGVTGAQRNEAVKKALAQLVEDSSLVMAQPFIDSDLERKFKIDPSLSVKLSSKDNMQLFIPPMYIPKTYYVLSSGAELCANIDTPVPCVIKVANSSSGDGVSICYTDEDVASTREKFKNVESTILVEQFIEVKHNLCVQFGVPYDKSCQPEVIGFNEQITSPQGFFLGGVVNTRKHVESYEKVKEVILSEIAPKLADLGWYGIGGIDVLIQEDGSFYFIDPNLRLTATYAYVYLTAAGQVKRPILSFSGKVCADRSEFEKNVLPFASGDDPAITIITITEKDEIFRFNAGIQFNTVDDLKTTAQDLLNAGVEAVVLDSIVNGEFIYDMKQ